VSGGFRQFSAAELDDACAAYQRNYNYRSMNCGRGSAEIVVLAGTSKFQHVLAQAAAAPRPWRHEYDRHLPALLARDPDDPPSVAALIDSNVVGYLPAGVADRHRSQLDELAAADQHLVCSALLVGGAGGKNFGVRLQVTPGIGTRWAAGAKPASQQGLPCGFRGGEGVEFGKHGGASAAPMR
jgi:hypothetical protein